MTDVQTETRGIDADPLEGFVPFRRVGGRAAGQSLVTVRKTGSISFDNAVFEALGSASAAQLLWHRQRRVIALRAANPNDPDAALVRKPARSTSYLLAISAFARWAGIELDATQRYTPEIQQGVLLVDLTKEPVKQPEAARSSKRGERQLAGV